MSLRDNFTVWDLPHRCCAWTGYTMALLFLASMFFMLVSFATKHVAWGLFAAGASIIALTIGYIAVGGIALYDRRHHHHAPRPL